MLLSYRDPRFWEKFRRRHWQPRVPVVLRRPFRNSPFTEERLLRGMNAFGAGIAAGDERSRHIFSLNGKRPGPVRTLRAIFREPSGSMPELERACARAVGRGELGLMINDFQSLDPELWDGFSAFLQDAHRWIDFPVARAIVDLFFGNYRQSFFGVHKDTQEIFAFVMRGRKTMLFWPFDYFLSRAPGVTAAAWYYQMGLDVDYRRYRRDALVLEAGPGDVIYWPRDYWHVAEGRRGEFAAMMSLGLFLTPYVPDRRARDLAAFREVLLKGDSLRSGDMTPVSRGRLGARRLRWATATAFEPGSPAMKETPPAGAKVVKKPTTLLLWSRRGERVLVSANGHSASFPSTAAVRRVLAGLARGGAVRLPRPPGRLAAWLFRIGAVLAR